MASTSILKLLKPLSALFLAAAVLSGAGAASAQQAPAAPAVGQAELESLLKSVENDAERQKLIDQLKALIAAQQPAGDGPKPASSVGTTVIGILGQRAKDAGEAFLDAGTALDDAPKLLDWLSEQVTDTEARERWLRIILKLIVVAVAAVAAGTAARRVLRRPREAVEQQSSESVLVRLLFLAIRTLLDLIPVAAAAVAGYAILPITEPADLTRLVVVTIINAYVLAGAIMVFARMILAPRVKGLRFIPASGETSNYLYIWTRRFTFLWVYGSFGIVAAGLLGLPGGGQQFADTFLGLLIAAMAVIFVLQNRRPFAEFLHAGGERPERGHPLTALRNRIADIWHALAIIYIAAVYGIWALRIEDGFENFLGSSVITAAAVVIAILISHGIHRAIQRGFSIRDELKARYPGLEQRANRYLPVMERVLHVFVLIIALTVIFQAWGLDVVAWLQSPAGSRIVSAAASIAIVLIVALVVWEAASAAIERYLDKAEEGAEALARRDRARTLLPLLRNALFFFIAVLVVLVVLAELGVNIGPLLAGAGIAGLAIGFGSQKLVQDVITGAFMLFEDAVAVGDVARVAGTAGRVEDMSIRSIRLRDLSGNVHTIPFSAIDTVTNMTKEWSYYVFEVGIAYREDVDEVIGVLEQLGEEIQADDNFGPKILEPLEVLGLDSFGDSAIVIKARFKTMPIEQWSVGREFNRRIKRRFDELGIEIPSPHHTIYCGSDTAGGAPAAPVRMETGRSRTKSAEPAKPARTAGAPSAAPSSSGQVEGGDGE